MGSRSRACVLAALAVLALTGGAFSFVPAAHAAAVCPTVGPGGDVSPPPAPGVDWSGCDLRGAVLQNGDLSGANLTGANMFAAYLNNMNLDSTDLSNVSLKFGSFLSSDIDNADLSGAELADMHAQGISGSPAALPADWRLVSGYLIGPGANMLHDDLTGADLSGIDLAGAVIGGFLVDADLSDANLRDAQLGVVGMTGANLSGTDMTNSSLSDISSGGVTGVPVGLPAPWVLRGGYLLGPTADLQGQHFSGFDFRGTDLDGANFFQAHLTNANFANVNLKDALMVEADLIGADLFGARIAGANWNIARCPGGLVYKNNVALCIRAFNFSGFASPRPGSAVHKSAGSFKVTFKLQASRQGAPLASNIANAVADAHRIRVELTGPGIHATTAGCTWSKATGAFQCRVKIPARVMTGRSHAYQLMAQERPGAKFGPAPVATPRRVSNPVTIYFR
jgi:uncharacterized protein YjbI with pentapeptide repeats